jgi:hypothetical protein
MKNLIKSSLLKPFLVLGLVILIIGTYSILLAQPSGPKIIANDFWGRVVSLEENSITAEGYFNINRDQIGDKVFVTIKINKNTKFEKTVHYYDMSEPDPSGNNETPYDVLPGAFSDFSNKEFNIRDIKVHSDKNIFGKQVFFADLVKYEYLIVQR